jgi:hypothetical protein
VELAAWKEGMVLCGNRGFTMRCASICVVAIRLQAVEGSEIAFWEITFELAVPILEQKIILGLPIASGEQFLKPERKQSGKHLTSPNSLLFLRVCNLPAFLLVRNASV